MAKKIIRLTESELHSIIEDSVNRILLWNGNNEYTIQPQMIDEALIYSYDANVVAEDGPYHNLANELSWSTFAATKTWPLFNKNFQALADAYDKVIVDLKNEGKVSELLIKFLGEDTTVYLND